METRSMKAISNYLSVLLEEPSSVDSAVNARRHQIVELKPLAELLARVSDAAPAFDTGDEISPVTDLEKPIIAPEPICDIAPVLEQDNYVGAVQQLEESPLTHNTLRDQMPPSFPVLYFKLADLTMAVPLVKIRAIFSRQTVTKLVGTPDWFEGIQVERGQPINVINTAQYLLAEKYNLDIEQSLNYKYIIVLSDSNWGLLCEELIDSSTVNHDDVKWRARLATSPWRAGTVTQRMCGLLAVDGLTCLLASDAEC